MAPRQTTRRWSLGWPMRGDGNDYDGTDPNPGRIALEKHPGDVSTDRDFEAYERILQLRRHHVGN
jgi:hypothetical protein